jgi:hypothetical protein
MGVAIYYTARRVTPLSDDEMAEVESVIDLYNQTAPLVEYDMLGSYSVTESSEILSGSTKLPLAEVSPADLQELIDHWLAGISELRRVVSGAQWDVRLDNFTIPWFGGEDGYRLEAY